ncbi:polyprenyl synthetase family protein [Thermogutta sp.]|uniref:polyprenyl synthetase family protein n=1 Tax=Thermogutta sp. TaxID=1962930 RepID=UPI00322059EC
MSHVKIPSYNWQETASHLEEMRQRIDAELARRTDFPEGCPPRLKEAIRYSLLSPGKRFRPLLVLLSTEACGKEWDRALPAACAVEMIHAYSLIHDDLPAMDNDDLRRGQPTCHRKFGEATAILAGDALLTLAFETLAKDIHPPHLAAECCRLLAEAAGPCQLVGGQADDILAAESDGSLDLLESIHRRKTGALIEASLMLGGTVAEATEEVLRGLREYGRALGLAFQITDDLLDLEGDEKLVGKRLKKDDAQKKLTFPRFLGIEKSREMVGQLLSRAAEVLGRLPIDGRHLVALAFFVGTRKH